MKPLSIQSKFLITFISAMLAISVFIGGVCLYEVDNFVYSSTGNLINLTCSKEAMQINSTFEGMEKSVEIMESYILDFIAGEDDYLNPRKQDEILSGADEMFKEIAINTNGAVSYYIRFAPEISDNKTGLFYIRSSENEAFTPCEPTDISLYQKDDTEHVGWYWEPYEAGKSIWMSPYYNRNIDILMISYVIPLYYESNFLGVVGMDFDYTVLTDRIDKIKMYEHGYAHLEDDGLIAYHKNYTTGSKVPDVSAEYLSVSEKIHNGMTLVLSASYDDIWKIRYDIGIKILWIVLLFGVLFSVVVILIVRKIVHPLKKLTQAAELVSGGNYNVEITHSNTREIELLNTAFEHMTLRLQEHDKLQHLLAYRDSLTGLRNTTSYKAWVDDFNKSIHDNDTNFGLVVLDINYLKETNDKFGHDTGNKLIITAAHTIADTFKRSQVFRIGGDEFLVILQGRDLQEYDSLIKKFEEACVNKYVPADNEKIPLSIAKGFTLFDTSKDNDFSEVFNRADDAMYENKRKMKGQI